MKEEEARPVRRLLQSSRQDMLVARIRVVAEEVVRNGRIQDMF